MRNTARLHSIYDAAQRRPMQADAGLGRPTPSTPSQRAPRRPRAEKAYHKPPKTARSRRVSLSAILDGEQPAKTPFQSSLTARGKKKPALPYEADWCGKRGLGKVLDGAHAHYTRPHAVACRHKRPQKEVLDSPLPSSTLGAMLDGGTPEYVGESCTRRLHAIQPPQTLCSAPCGGQSIRSMVLDGSSPSNTKFGFFL